MRLQHEVGLVMALLAAWTFPLAGQADDTHQGFWISFGGGGGWSTGRVAVWYVRMGGTPHNRAQFGGEVMAWWREEGPGQDFQMQSVTVTTMIYPLYPATAERRLLREWFVKAGFGVAAGERAPGNDGEGISTSLGTGFHFRLDRKFFVTPTFDLVLQFFETRTVTAALFTVGFSWP